MSKNTCRVIAAASLSMLVAFVSVSLQGVTAWDPGDVVVAIGGGQYNVYDNLGVYKETITQTDGETSFAGFTTGCAFDSSGDLYTTNFSNTKVIKFEGDSPHDVLQVIDTAVQSPGGHSESIVFAANGDFYVGHPDGNDDVHRYNAAGTFQQAYDVAIEARGSDWMDLAADQRTLFYTSEGRQLKRYDVSGAGAQLADFATLSSTGPAFALRLLPPGNGSGGLLVADSVNIKRLDGSGTVVQTYDADDEDGWFALNLDPDGTSFWAGNPGTGNFYRFNITTGFVEVGPVFTVTPDLDEGIGLFGICVKGEPTAGQAESDTFTYDEDHTSHTSLFDDGNVGYKLNFRNGVNTSYSLMTTAYYIEQLPAWVTDNFPGCRLIRYAQGGARGALFRIDPEDSNTYPEPNVDFNPPYLLYISSFANWLTNTNGSPVCRIRLPHRRSDGTVADIFNGYYPEGTPGSDPGAGGEDTVFSEYLVCDDPPASPLTVQWKLPKPDGSSAFKEGRTAPFRFTLRDPRVANAVCRLTVARLTNGSPELVPIDASGRSNTDNLFRSSAGNYVYNLSLKGFAPGRYVANVSCDTSCNSSVLFSVFGK